MSREEMKGASAAPAAAPVKSPCVSVCALNDDGLCIGCWRSVDEIAQWSRLEPAQQRAVIARARSRAQAAGCWL